MSTKLDDLKAEAKQLGINFSAQIGEVKLQEKIDAYYESQETSGPELMAKVEAKEKAEAEEETVSNGPVKSISDKQRRQLKAKEKEQADRKTRVVTIVDNDKRVNSQTEFVIVNCGNMYYDLGTKKIPLNVAVEVAQGFINVLKNKYMNAHVQDNKTGLFKTTRRPRYTISYEDMNPDN